MRQGGRRARPTASSTNQNQNRCSTHHLSMRRRHARARRPARASPRAWPWAQQHPRTILLRCAGGGWRRATASRGAQPGAALTLFRCAYVAAPCARSNRAPLAPATRHERGSLVRCYCGALAAARRRGGLARRRAARPRFPHSKALRRQRARDYALSPFFEQQVVYKTPVGLVVAGGLRGRVRVRRARPPARVWSRAAFSRRSRRACGPGA